MAAKVGYCGLDRRRAPLAGDEIRACWEAAGSTLESGGGSPLPLFGPPVAGDLRRDFVEVAPASADARLSPADDDRTIEPPFDMSSPAGPEPGWSLWADLDA